MKKMLLCLTFSSVFAYAATAQAGVEILANKNRSYSIPQDTVVKNVENHFAVDQYRTVRVQPIYNEAGAPDHLLVYLHSKTQHRVELASVKVDANYAFGAIERDYAISSVDSEQQPGLRAAAAACPDESVEFISFAPNDDDYEQGIAKDVAKSAEAANLKTVLLLGEDATRSAYLNYMTCPKLRGNFYDGDANTTVIVTNDGEISYKDFTKTLKGAFGLRVTNIWLACEAFNNPIKPAVMTSAQSRKYAAGKNDLEVGPSDETAACAMKAAIAGQPMTAAFQSCYESLDTPADEWGFDGAGSDNFWD